MYEFLIIENGRSSILRDFRDSSKIDKEPTIINSFIPYMLRKIS